MARILFLLALGVGIYLFIRHYARRNTQNNDQGNTHKTSAPVRDVVKCAHCKTYVPRDEAIAMHGEFFCCKQHARDWRPPT